MTFCRKSATLYSFSKVFAHSFLIDSIELGQPARKDAINYEYQYISFNNSPYAKESKV